VKLERRLGLEGVKSLQILWMWVAENRPSGDLRGSDETLTNFNDRSTTVKRKFNEEDIEIAARWNGDENRFIDTLVDLGWVDKTDTGYVIHGWAEHNQWASCATSRGDRARFSRLAKVNPQLYKKMKDQGFDSISSKEYNDAINDSSTVVERSLTNRITPAPAPAPAPSLLKDYVVTQTDESTTPEPIPYSQIISFLNEKAGCKYKSTTKSARGHIKARWNEGHRLPDFQAVIESKVAEWGPDEKMCQYLRPETLFGTKFDSYLQIRQAGSAARCAANGDCGECLHGWKPACKAKTDGQRKSCSYFEQEMGGA